jgi:hypothetical protein
VITQTRDSIASFLGWAGQGSSAFGAIRGCTRSRPRASDCDKSREMAAADPDGSRVLVQASLSRTQSRFEADGDCGTWAGYGALRPGERSWCHPVCGNTGQNLSLGRVRFPVREGAFPRPVPAQLRRNLRMANASHSGPRQRAASAESPAANTAMQASRRSRSRSHPFEGRLGQRRTFRSNILPADNKLSEAARLTLLRDVGIAWRACFTCAARN